MLGLPAVVSVTTASASASDKSSIHLGAKIYSSELHEPLDILVHRLKRSVFSCDILCIYSVNTTGLPGADDLK